MTDQLAADDPRHGTVNGYGNLKCSCDACRAAWAAKYREIRADRAKAPLAADDPRHGLNSTYANHGCRCMECTVAHRQWNQRYYKK